MCKMGDFLILFLVFLSAFHFHESARILVVVPTAAISHQVVFRPLTQELAKRGHEVTVVTTHPAFPKGMAPANLTEIDLHDISNEVLSSENLYIPMGKNTVQGMKNGFLLVYKVFEKQIQSKQLQEILQKNSDYYDLLIVEGWFRLPLVFSYVFKAPVIQMSSFGAVIQNFEAMGLPIHPLLYPAPAQQRIYNLNMWEKITELYNYYWLLKVHEDFDKISNDLVRRNFGPNVPALRELANNVQILFLNIHPIFEGNYPVPPSIVHIGGIHTKTQEKELPKDLKTLMDSSKNGVIYMSLGTNADPTLLPPEKIQIFVKVFSKLQYDVLFKWNKDDLPGRTDNIRIGKWFPQSDLLRHPKLKLFITQGGLQSTDEAIEAGVPLVGVPMRTDQFYNTEKYEHLKIGVKLEIERLTEDQLRSSIETVIGNASYRENVVRLRTLMRDQPSRPLQRAVWWTEHVLRHGGAGHLRAPAANMHWTHYYEIELVLTLLSGLITLFLSLTVFIAYQKYNWIERNILVFRIKVKKH